MVRKFVFAGFVALGLISCKNENQNEKEIAKTSVSFDVERFDTIFAQAGPEDLRELKTDYPQFFPAQFNDSIWLNRLSGKDTLQTQINKAVEQKYADFSEEKEKLHRLFQHLDYYFPDFDPPQVITTTSYVDFRNRVLLSDGTLIIALDNFLGADHKFYRGIQRYIAKNLKETQILPEVAYRYAKKFVPKPKTRSFLGYMVYYGKLLYFKEKMLPGVSEGGLIGYTDDELDWAKSNEKQIWGYMVENSLLYDTDPEWRKDYFDNGPFTKFGLNLDSESSPQLGRYIGWQIVKQYADKFPDVPLKDLLKTDHETLYDESNYKPNQD